MNRERQKMIKKKKEAMYRVLMEIAKTEKNSDIFFKMQNKYEQLKLELFGMEYR